jgi:hypothetical protein
MSDLAKLKQSEVAWLIGKPASWIRGRAHQFERNSDGSYNGRTVFRTMAELLGTVEFGEAEWELLVAYARSHHSQEAHS